MLRKFTEWKSLERFWLTFFFIPHCFIHLYRRINIVFGIHSLCVLFILAMLLRLIWAKLNDAFVWEVFFWKFIHLFDLYVNAAVYSASNWIYFHWNALAIPQILTYEVATSNPVRTAHCRKLDFFFANSHPLFALAHTLFFWLVFLAVTIYLRYDNFFIRLFFSHLNWFECVCITNAFSYLWFFSLPPFFYSYLMLDVDFVFWAFLHFTTLKCCRILLQSCFFIKSFFSSVLFVTRLKFCVNFFYHESNNIVLLCWYLVR